MEDDGNRNDNAARRHYLQRATSRTQLKARTVTTTHQLAGEVAISPYDQPFWTKAWHRGLGD